jgi:hypothetical protein
MSQLIQSSTQQLDKYSLRMEHMPDHGAVRNITIWNEGMTSEELGEIITTLDREYQPLKFVIIRHDK